VARAYGVHPVTLANWKRHFLQHGAEVFGGNDALDGQRITPYSGEAIRSGTRGIVVVTRYASRVTDWLEELEWGSQDR